MKRSRAGLIAAASIALAGGLVMCWVALRGDGGGARRTVKNEGENSNVERGARITPQRLSLAVEAVKKEAKMRPLREPEDDFDTAGIRYRISNIEVSRAIRVCGEAQSREAIAALVQLADAPDRTAGHDIPRNGPDVPAWLVGQGVTPAHIIYPAAAALVAIGKESTPELMDALAQSPPPASNHNRDGKLLEILVDIQGVEGTRRLLSDKISQLTNDEEKKRLAGHLIRLGAASPNPPLGDKGK